MCRDNDHGGRRCPADTSEARRLRRANAGARNDFKQLAAPLLETELTGHNEQPEAVPSITIDTIKETIAELDELKKYDTQIFMRTPSGEYSMPFESLSHRYAAQEANIPAMESKVIEIGAQVTSVALGRTGFTDEKIQEVMVEEQRHFLKLHDEVEAELIAYQAELLTKYADPENPSSSGWVLLRRAIIKDETNLEARADEAKYEALQKQKQEYNMEVQKALQGRSEQVLQMLKTNATTFTEVLGEIRPLGGDIVVAENSAKREVKIMAEVAKVYPTAWIEDSNNGNSLRIKYTKSRAHYNDSASQNTFTVSEMHRGTTKPKDWKPDGISYHEQGWIAIPDGEDWVHPTTGVIHTNSAREGETFWIYPHYEYFNRWDHRSRDGVPVGHGWEKTLVRNYPDDGTTREEWRRIKRERRQTSWGVRQAELTIDSEPSAYGPTGYPTALHEFAHRIEAKGPKFLDTMQEEFLRRRTTSVDGEHETLRRIYPKKKEYGRFDNFADKYMGKEYSGTRHHEILSTGAEAVFAGKFGSLSGVGNYKADPDMKNFILGLFAAA